jgi:hypothetical protein
MPVIMNKRSFWTGVVLLLLFSLPLILLFAPVFNGNTGLQASDGLFNSLSKGSSYHIPTVAAEVEKFHGTGFEAKIETKDAVQAEVVAKIFGGAGASVVPEAEAVIVSGDLGAVLDAVILDADELFNQQEGAIETRYGVDNARAVLYYWHDALSQMEKSLLYNGHIQESLFVKKVMVRAVESAYNFAGIESARISERVGITAFLLTFYVLYTIWYGFGIMYLFEGLGVTVSSKR